MDRDHDTAFNAKHKVEKKNNSQNMVLIEKCEHFKVFTAKSFQRIDVIRKFVLETQSQTRKKQKNLKFPFKYR